MPNTNAPQGFLPVRYRNGGPWNGAAREYFVPASDGTALFRGDPVIIAGSGDANGVPTCTRSTAGGRVTGVVVGFRPSATIEANGFRAASTAEYVMVADDPELLFECQENNSAAFGVADIGLNADMVAAAGSAVTKMSGFQLATSTKATTATLGWRIIGVVQRADNEVGPNVKLLVANNLPTETGAAGATGV